MEQRPCEGAGGTHRELNEEGTLNGPQQQFEITDTSDIENWHNIIFIHENSFLKRIRMEPAL